MIAIGTLEQIEALELKSRKSPSKRWADPLPFGAKYWIKVKPFTGYSCEDKTIDDILDDNELHYINESHFKVLRQGLDGIPNITASGDFPNEIPDSEPETRESLDSDEDIQSTAPVFDFTVISGIGKVSAKKITDKGFIGLNEVKDWLIGTDLETACEYFDLDESQIEALVNYEA